MIRTYTLHVPAEAEPGEPDALGDAELVKDGFVWSAFLLGPCSFLWFFWHRLWLAGIGVLVAVCALGVVLQLLGVRGQATVLAGLFLAVLIGLEANHLKRWTWRRTKPAVDVVSASDRDEAEAKAFARWLEHPGPHQSRRMPISRAATGYGGPQPVIGLFPEMERPR